jgi:hypothetical protein
MAAERLREAATRAAASGEIRTSALGEFGVLIAGKWLKTGEAVEVHSPYDDALVAVIHRAGAAVFLHMDSTQMSIAPRS